MSIKICMYFRNQTELDKVRAFLSLTRYRDAGLTSNDIEQIIKDEKEIRRIDDRDKKSEKAKPVEQPAEPKHTAMDDLDAYLGRKPSHPALQSNTSQAETVSETESRTIPHTLKPFVEQGWDLETAFRIYDEWHEEFNNFTDGKPPVKPLGERFMEERMKRDADESAK